MTRIEFTLGAREVSMHWPVQIIGVEAKKPPAIEVVDSINKILLGMDLTNWRITYEAQMASEDDRNARQALLDKLRKLHVLMNNYALLRHNLNSFDGAIQTFIPAISGEKKFNEKEREEALRKIDWLKDYAQSLPQGDIIQEKLDQLTAIFKIKMTQEKRLGGLMVITRRPEVESPKIKQSQELKTA